MRYEFLGVTLVLCSVAEALAQNEQESVFSKVLESELNRVTIFDPKSDPEHSEKIPNDENKTDKDKKDDFTFSLHEPTRDESSADRSAQQILADINEPKPSKKKKERKMATENPSAEEASFTGALGTDSSTFAPGINTVPTGSEVSFLQTLVGIAETLVPSGELIEKENEANTEAANPRISTQQLSNNSDSTSSMDSESDMSFLQMMANVGETLQPSASEASFTGALGSNTFAPSLSTIPTGSEISFIELGSGESDEAQPVVTTTDVPNSEKSENKIDEKEIFLTTSAINAARSSLRSVQEEESRNLHYYPPQYINYKSSKEAFTPLEIIHNGPRHEKIIIPHQSVEPIIVDLYDETTPSPPPSTPPPQKKKHPHIIIGGASISYKEKNEPAEAPEPAPVVNIHQLSGKDHVAKNSEVSNIFEYLKPILGIN